MLIGSAITLICLGVKKVFRRLKITKLYRALTECLKIWNPARFEEIVNGMSKQDHQDFKGIFKYPLMTISVAFENLDAVRFLVEQKGMDVNEVAANKETALIRACHFNRLEIIRYLLGRGADLEMRTSQDVSALLTAIY